MDALSLDQTSTLIDIPGKISLKKGYQLYIVVEREDGLQWIIIVKTSAAGKWRTLYGFTYVPDWSTPKTYQSVEVADTDPSEYTVSEINSSDVDNYSNLTPTIMFTWTPSSNGSFYSNQFYKLGVTGGIALDLEKPTAMFGPTVLFAQNLSLSTGIIFTERPRLKPEYTPNQTIMEDLDFEQLHDAGLETYRPAWFFSIGFRFNQNPFKSKDSADESDSSDED